MNKQQRQVIAHRLTAIAKAHGGEVEFMEDYAPMRHTTLSLAFDSVGVSTDIDGKFAMLHWHGAKDRLNPAVFGHDAVNKAHGRKATKYRDQWEPMYAEFTRLCAAVQSGVAFLPAQVTP
jgi:hypothetical protein